MKTLHQPLVSILLNMFKGYQHALASKRLLKRVNKNEIEIFRNLYKHNEYSLKLKYDDEGYFMKP